MILPTYLRNYQRADLEQMVGSWTVEGTPQFPKSHSNLLEGQGGTPFQFTLKSLMVDSIEAIYAPDVPGPDAESTFSGGATFRAKASMWPKNVPLTFQEQGYEQLSFKAEIFPDGGEVVRTIYGTASPPGSAESALEITWDGKDSIGNPVPGGTIYGIRITAMLDRQTRPAEESRGLIWTPTPQVGPPGVAPLDTKALTITPDPYIPYSPEELVVAYDPDGNPVWPDDDGDGSPDRFPDHDGNGLPDFEPWEGPPPLSITADPSRPGYTTSWRLSAYKEDGTEIVGDNPNDGPPWSGAGPVDIEWLPPSDLEPQELKFLLTVTECRKPPDVQVLSQTSGAACKDVVIDGTVAYDPGPRLEILGPEGAVWGIGLAPSSGGPNDSKEAYRLFSAVHHAEPGISVRFRVSGVVHDSDTLSMSLSNTTTGAIHPRGIVLTKTSQSSANYLSEPVTLAEDLLLSRTDPKKPDGAALKTLHAVGFISEGIYSVTRIFQEQVVPKYPADRLGLGKFSLIDAFDLDGTEPFPELATLALDLVPATKSNLQTLGFEGLQAELIPEGDVPPLKASIKVSSPAHLAVFNFHGDHYTGAVRILDDQFRSGQAFLPLDLDDRYARYCDTLFFVACDVLDVNDYNNYLDWKVLSSETLEESWTPQAARPNPGLKWHSEFIQKNVSNRPPGRPSQVLLGYNGPAPIWYVDEVLSEYARQLDVFQGAANQQQMAWMTANLVVGQMPDPGTASAPPALTLQACAIDAERYYYIPLEYGNVGTDRTFSRVNLDSVSGVYWVERAKWSQTPQEWDWNLLTVEDQGGGLAQPARRL